MKLLHSVCWVCGSSPHFIIGTILAELPRGSRWCYFELNWWWGRCWAKAGCLTAWITWRYCKHLIVFIICNVANIFVDTCSKINCNFLDYKITDFCSLSTLSSHCKIRRLPWGASLLMVIPLGIPPDVPEGSLSPWPPSIPLALECAVPPRCRLPSALWWYARWYAAVRAWLHRMN